MSRMNRSTSPLSELDARLRADARARRRPPRPERVAGVLEAIEHRPPPRPRERLAVPWLISAAAALLLIVGGLLWPGWSEAPAPSPPTAPAPTRIAEAHPAHDLLGHAIAFSESLREALAAERQFLMLDLQHVNDAIWSGLPEKSQLEAR